MRTIPQMASDFAWPMAAALAVILFVTLIPVLGPAEEVSAVCLICGPYGAADFVLNVLLFVPLGYTAARRLGDPGRALALVVAITVGIELLQFLIPGRHPTLGDITANSLGGALSIWVGEGRSFKGISRWIPHALAVMLVGTVLAHEPSLPDSSYTGQWTPTLRSFDQYGGRVTRALIGGLDLPSGSVDQTVQDSVLRAPQGVPITVEYIAGPGPLRVAPLLRVTDQHEREVLLVGAQGNAIVVRMRRLAQTIRLHAPQARFPRAHPPEGTESWVRFERRGRELCIGTPETAGCRSSVTPARGWFLLTGISLPLWASLAADTLWLAGLAILISLGKRGIVRWLPTFVYAALWILLQGDLAWAPGFLGILVGSASVAVFDRTPESRSPLSQSV